MATRPLRLFKTFREFQLRVTGGFHGRARSGELVVGADEDADLGRSDSIGHGLLDPVGHACDFALGIGEYLDFRIGAVEHGHGAAPVLLVPVNVLHDLGQKAIGGLPDLVRRSIVDLERARAATNIDAKRLPRKRLLKDALAEIAGKEKRIGAARRDGGEHPQFRHAEVLGFVDHGMGERLVGPLREIRRDFSEDGRPGQKPLRLDELPRPHKDGPELLPLLDAKAVLAAKARNLLIGFKALQLPRIDDIEPFRCEKARREAGQRSLACRRFERPANLILGRRPRVMTERQREQLAAPRP